MFEKERTDYLLIPDHMTSLDFEFWDNFLKLSY